MAYINCIARVKGRPPKSKKELREAIKQANETDTDTYTMVEFISTDLITSGQFFGRNDWPVGGIASVVGPSAVDRKWYATVELKGGKLVMK